MVQKYWNFWNLFLKFFLFSGYSILLPFVPCLLLHLFLHSMLEFELFSQQILNNNLKKYMPTYTICSTEINILRILHYICPKMTFSSEFLKTFFFFVENLTGGKKGVLFTLCNVSQNDLLDIRLSKKSSQETMQLSVIVIYKKSRIVEIVHMVDETLIIGMQYFL